MSKEGYLQLKVGELKDKIEQSEARVNTVLEKITKKERDIIALIDRVSPKIEEGDELLKTKIEATKCAEELMESAKLFHIKNYKMMLKKIVKHTNNSMKEITKILNFTIIDHGTQASIVTKLLIDKKIIDGLELIQYIKKYQDEVRDALLEEYRPQESLKVAFDFDHEVFEDG